MSELSTVGLPGDLLESFCRAYGDRDIERLMDCFIDASDCVVLGLGENDRRMGSEEIRDFFLSDWTTVEKSTFNPLNIVVSQSGAVAWLVADMRVQARLRGRYMQSTARLTGVAREAASAWRWCQLHLSIPADVQ